MAKKCHGFSLIETMIAVLVLSMVALMLYQGIQSARSEITFGADHLSALLLSQKVLEDCIQEMDVNPNGLATLGLDTPNPSPVALVDGASPFFSNLEDRAAPWHKIQGGPGETLDQNFGPLYTQVKDFKIQANSTRQTTDQNMSLVNIELSWKAKTGTGNMPMSCFVYSPVLPKQTSIGLVVDDSVLEKVICRRLFVCPPMSMTGILSTYGGNTDTLKAYATLAHGAENVMYSSFYLNTMNAIGKNEKLFKTLSGSPKNQTYFDLVKKLAGDNYQIARVAFNAMLVLQPHMEKAMIEYDETFFGTYLWDKRRRHHATACMIDYVMLSKLFVERLFYAKTYYEILIEKDMAEFQDMRRIQINLVRVMDIYKILLLVPSSPVTQTHFVTFFRHVKSFADGRHQALVRLAQMNIDLATNVPALLEKNPNLQRVNAVIERLPLYYNCTSLMVY